MKKFLKLILILFFLFSFFDLNAAQEIKIVHLTRVIEREPTIYSINPQIKKLVRRLDNLYAIFLLKIRLKKN